MKMALKSIREFAKSDCKTNIENLLLLSLLAITSKKQKYEKNLHNSEKIVKYVGMTLTKRHRIFLTLYNLRKP